MKSYLIVYIDPYNKSVTRNTRIKLDDLLYVDMLNELWDRYLEEYRVEPPPTSDFIILNVIKLDD